MINNESGGEKLVDLESARWEIRQLIYEMAKRVIHAHEIEKNLQPYDVGVSELHYRWLRFAAGDLVEKVESDSTRVRGTDVTPSMLHMAQTSQELLDGKDIVEASAVAERLWGDTYESVSVYAPRAMEEILFWRSKRLLASMELEQVLSVFRESGYNLTEEEFVATFEARHKSGPDQAAWQRLSHYLRAGEEEIADLIARHKREDSE